jgi:ribosome-binding protein aMBF1 (putative translation factor)
MDIIDTTLGRGRKGREAFQDEEIDARFQELRASLGEGLREMRLKTGMKQADLAARLERSAAAVSFMESAKPGVSIELQLKALFLLGASLQDLARMIQGGKGGGKNKKM